MKRLIALALLAVAAFGQTVYLTPTGKTFHKIESCPILKRSAKVLHAEKSDAEQHAMKPCRSCYSVRKSNNSGWAK